MLLPTVAATIAFAGASHGAPLLDAYSGHAGVLAASHQEEHIDRGDLATAVRSEQERLVWLVAARHVRGAVTGVGVRA